jgi:nitroimidazol reductase NimA-like FMN-containing flavoprotein (pyridoxamine 5'-phosphate oxidase superfamily)
MMEEKAIDFLSRRRVMSIATLRPDGWPQNTMVGYANDGLLIYFLISRQSQKLANIVRNDRVSIAIGEAFSDPHEVTGLSLAARASEVTDRAQRELARELLWARHPEFGAFPKPDITKAAIMRARPEVITVLDYREEFGHADILFVGADMGALMEPARPDDWGLTPAS